MSLGARRWQWPVVALVGLVYGVLVLVMWSPFSLYSGMGFETAFPVMSETSSVLGGFLYRVDPLRLHTNTFYHLSYLVAEVLGVRGSYVPYQVVHALLWWARGFLVFLILRDFLRPGNILVCYIAGALVLVHASDGATQWIGQMNQFGFIFWMLLACYLLTSAFKATNWALTAGLTIVACSCEYMSQWSYESQILLLLLFPLALPLMFLRRRWSRLAAISAVWYPVLGVYLWLTAARYVAGGQTYQQSVMRKTWGLAVIDDWLFNISASLKFWSWTNGVGEAQATQVVLLALAGAVVFIVGGVAVIGLLGAKGAAHLPLPDGTRPLWVLLVAGLVALVLSFPVYLVLDSARALWRTQLLSGIGSGLVLASSFALTSHLLATQKGRIGVLLTLGAVVVSFGSAAAIEKGAFHRRLWERHRFTMTQILRVAPSVKPNTIVVLANVPKDNDPFGHNMWLDLALRLSYPGIPVAGEYFYTDGTPGPGHNLGIAGGRWKWDGTAYPPALHDAALADTIIVEYNESGYGTLVGRIPAFLCPVPCAADQYNPARVITGSISPIAARRYRLGSNY